MPNGARLYYEVAGEGHPLALVHGFTLDTRMWDAQFEMFAQHYRVIRYDLPTDSMRLSWAFLLT